MNFEALMRETVRDVVREEFAAIRDELKAALQPRDKREEYLSTSAAAKLLGLHPETVRTMVREGRLPRREIAGHLRFVRAEIDKLLSAGLPSSTVDEAAAFVAKAVTHGSTARNY